MLQHTQQAELTTLLCQAYSAKAVTCRPGPICKGKPQGSLSKKSVRRVRLLCKPRLPPPCTRIGSPTLPRTRILGRPCRQRYMLERSCCTKLPRESPCAYPYKDAPQPEGTGLPCPQDAPLSAAYLRTKVHARTILLHEAATGKPLCIPLQGVHRPKASDCPAHRRTRWTYGDYPPPNRP